LTSFDLALTDADITDMNLYLYLAYFPASKIRYCASKEDYT